MGRKLIVDLYFEDQSIQLLFPRSEIVIISDCRKWNTLPIIIFIRWKTQTCWPFRFQLVLFWDTVLNVIQFKRQLSDHFADKFLMIFFYKPHQHCLFLCYILYFWIIFLENNTWNVSIDNLSLPLGQISCKRSK